MGTAFNDGTLTNVDFDGVLSFRNPEALTALEAIGAAVLARLKLSGGTLTGALILHADATNPLGAVTLQQLEAASLGLADSLKDVPCAAATTAALPTCTYNNGSSGVGATLTATANGLFPAQDGQTLTGAAPNKRVLVKNQASGAHNGVYDLTQDGSGSTPWILTRATDSDTAAELTQGVAVPVAFGTNSSQSGLYISNTAVTTVGTNAVTWTYIGGGGGIGAGSITAVHILDGELTAAEMASTFLDTSTDLDGASASDLKVATQKATRSFVLAQASPVIGRRSLIGMDSTIDYTGATNVAAKIDAVIDLCNPGDTLLLPTGILRVDTPIDPAVRGVTFEGTHGATENNNPANDAMGSIIRAGASMAAVVKISPTAGAYDGMELKRLRIDQNSLATVAIDLDRPNVAIDDVSTHRPPTNGIGLWGHGAADRCNVGRLITRMNYAAGSTGVLLEDVNDWDWWGFVRLDHCIYGLDLNNAAGMTFQSFHTSQGREDASFASLAGVRVRGGSHHLNFSIPYLDNVRGGSQVVFEDGATYHDIMFVAPHFLNGGWGASSGPGHAGLYPAVDIKLATSGSLRGCTFLCPQLMAETSGYHFSAAVRIADQSRVRGLQWLFPTYRYVDAEFVLSGGGAAYADVVAPGLWFQENAAGVNSNDSPRSSRQTYRVVSTTQNLNSYDRLVKCTASGVTLTLPPTGAVSPAQFRYPESVVIRNASAGTITVAGRTGGTADLIDGVASVTVAAATTATFIPDGTDWVRF